MRDIPKKYDIWLEILYVVLALVIVLVIREYNPHHASPKPDLVEIPCDACDWEI